MKICHLKVVVSILFIATFALHFYFRTVIAYKIFSPQIQLSSVEESDTATYECLAVSDMSDNDRLSMEFEFCSKFIYTHTHTHARTHTHAHTYSSASNNEP